MKFRPMHDKILVDVIERDDVTPGGIILNGQVTDHQLTGTVVSLGSGFIAANGEYKFSVKVGDTIIFDRHLGKNVLLDGKNYKLMPESEIMGICRDE